MSQGSDSKLAEKSYLERSGGSDWERQKPFSPPGTDTLPESLDLLHDFAVAVQLLQPALTDRILDVGAGGGWCSDLLQRLNRESIAVDISHDMLRIARQRGTRSALRSVTGDIERLPFLDGSFDKAICLNALHHVPDIAAGVREISRVLRDDGTAVFSEPGAGHAAMPGSQAAVRDFGVLEQEILVEPFLELCHTAGFADVRVCPISYSIREFQLTLKEWRAWQRLAKQKRPIRAARKIWRAALELAGIGKTSLNFEDHFAIRLVRLFQQPVASHPFVVAAKASGGAIKCPPYTAQLEVLSFASHVTSMDAIVATVRARNSGGVVWKAAAAPGAGLVTLGIQLLDEGGRVLVRDFGRGRLLAEVSPGESTEIVLHLAPPGPGRYQLKFDMVAEGVTWFEQSGSRPVVLALEVLTS